VVGSVRQQSAIARELIAQLDAAQERRALTDDEFNIRANLKRRSLGLASLSRSIARQCSRIRFLADGDANTRFFHLQSCHRSRKNHIVSALHDGNWVAAEESKADLIFNYYNELLGKPFVHAQGLTLDSLLPQLELGDLDRCFSEEEIWAVVRDLLSDRAPGPDGFTALFYKVAWGTIKADVLRAFNALWSLDYRSFHLLNGASTILLRKNEAPQILRDYRPISLIHSFSKLFTKYLAARLAPRLQEMVAQNQSAFIRNISIHDNYRIVQLACRSLHRKKHPSLLLKVDIAKAFDSVAWPFLLEVLEQLGFSRRWRDWISFILSTASTKVLVNGRLGRRIAHARGLHQGDPISPMLFVLALEPLNTLIKEVDRQGILTPLPLGDLQLRTSLYADDLVLWVAPKPEDLSCLRQIFELFGAASGLLVNVDKSVLSPIACEEGMVEQAVAAFPCVVAGFPIRYLGIPLSLGRLKRSDEQHLVDKIAAKIPTWKAGLLNDAGRTVLTKVTLSAVPVHFSIACCLSQWAIRQIDKRRRAFLWAGKDSVAGGRCKVAWVNVCKPPELGGLGVLDLRFFGFALRLRWEWLRRSEPNRCWTALSPPAEKVVSSMAAVSLTVICGDGNEAKFWTDSWSSVGPLNLFAPNLFGSVSRAGKRRSVRAAIAQRQWARDIVGATTTQVILQYLQVWNIAESVQLDPLSVDRFVWKWSPDGNYSASSTYRAFFHGSAAMLGARELWKTKAPPKVKFFV